MKRRQQILSATMALGVALAVCAAAMQARAEAPAPSSQPDANWIVVEARNHVRDTSGLVAVLFGVAQERGRSRPASLLVACFEGRTTVEVDVAGLDAGPFAIAVRQSLDGGRFVRVGGLALSGDRAIAFVSGLAGHNELRLAVARPLSVPLLVTFAVNGAEQALHALADRCHWSAGPAISDAGR